MDRSKDFTFSEPLIEGVIVDRRNRFIVDVDIDGTVYVCHCPCTGKIGNFDLRGRPCLLSKGVGEKRKTPFTMEALSFNMPEDKHKSWIGINQNANNRYIEHFLKNGALMDMADPSLGVLKEHPLGNSKIDFKVGDCFIEVKSPLWRIDIPVPDYISTHDNGEFSAVERLMKHLNSFISNLEPHQKAIMIVCFVYDHPGFVPGMSKNKSVSKVKRMFNKCNSLERWQVNLRISRSGVKLMKYFRLNSF